MAKRVKWEYNEEYGYEYVSLGTVSSPMTMIVNSPSVDTQNRWRVYTCYNRSERFFKASAPAKRYCLREAKKFHKLVGTQLTELERGE